MFRRRLGQSVLLLGGLQLAALGCAKDLDITKPIDQTQVVQAQLDPSNPIPVLQLVPLPTALVQDPTTHELDLTKVLPKPCEVPSTKQCLAFVDGGWPTSTPITLNFSGDIDVATVQDGIIFAEANGTPVPFTAKLVARQAPPEACQAGGNGGTILGEDGQPHDRTYSADAVPASDRVLVIEPSSPLKHNTDYVLIAKSSAAGGLKTADGQPVDPSGLFYLLNRGQSPIVSTSSTTHTIADALLRSSVEDSILKGYFGGKSADQLTAEQHVAFKGALNQAGHDLAGLYGFFAQIYSVATQTNLIKPEDRSSLVMMNAWHTGAPSAPAAQVMLDPANQVVPFPNSPMLTTRNMDGSLTVNLPNLQNDPTIAGLNTLNGFSTTAPIFIPVSSAADAATIDPTGHNGLPFACLQAPAGQCNIAMHVVADGKATAEWVPLIVMTSSTAIVVVPGAPLLQNKSYVVSVKKGIKDVAGDTFQPAQVFQFMELPGKFIDNDTVLDRVVNTKGGTFKQALECSTVETTGALADAASLATQLEDQAGHQRWLEAFTALETGSTALPRTDVTMAFGYDTEAITDVVDYAKGNLERSTNCTAQAPCWDDLLGGPQVIGPVLDIQGKAQIAAAIGVVGKLCVPVCQAGGMQGIDPAHCTDDLNALASHPTCQLATSLVTSRLARARLYMLKTFDALVGGPYQTAPGHAGTFTPTSLAHPTITTIPMWIVTGTITAGNEDAKFPTLVFQHGLGSQKEAGFYIANTFASTTQPAAVSPNGWATVMIDLPFHGTRASDLIHNDTGVPCDVDPNEVVCGADQAHPDVCTGGCDGIRDESGSGFLGINLFATRDNFRQGTIDQLALIHALRKESAPGHALDFLDTTHLGYVGQSLGGITGANLAAYLTPSEVQSMVLNVPGGGLIYNVLLKTVPEISAPLFAGLAARGICELNTAGNPASGCKSTPEFEQFKVIAQWILDPGDPAATSIGVTHELRAGRTPLTPAKVLIQMSLPDPVVPNDAGIALGRAYGLVTGTTPTSDHFQVYDFTMANRPSGSGCHPFLLAPVCGTDLFDTVCNTLGAQAQAARFIATAGQTVGPQRISIPGTPLTCN